MRDDDCIHLLPPGQCSYCKAYREAVPEPIRIFPAKYDGQCPNCNLPIHAGQMIAWIPDRSPVHEDCV